MRVEKTRKKARARIVLGIYPARIKKSGYGSDPGSYVLHDRNNVKFKLSIADSAKGGSTCKTSGKVDCQLIVIGVFYLNIPHLSLNAKSIPHYIHIPPKSVKSQK